MRFHPGTHLEVTMKTTTDVSNSHHSQDSHSALSQIKLGTLLAHQLARSIHLL